jgi:prophage regulatory protein
MKRVLFRKALRNKGVDYSDAQLHRLVKAGKFPAPIKIGENRNAWIEEEIDAYIQAKIAERDAQPISTAGDREGTT